MITFFVADPHIAGSSLQIVYNLNFKLADRFEMEDCGAANKYIGI